MAPHLGHVSNFCGVKAILLEPTNWLTGCEIVACGPVASRLGAHKGCVSNSDRSQDPKWATVRS